MGRKLRKLRRDPWLFWTDWAAKRSWAPALDKERGNRRRLVAHWEKQSVDCKVFSFDALLEVLSARVAILLCVDQRSYKFGIVEGHLVRALGAIQSFASGFGLRVYIEACRREVAVGEFLDEELMSILHRAGWVRVHLRRCHGSQTTTLMSADIYIYRVRSGRYQSASPAVDLQYLPKPVGDRLSAGKTGLWTPPDLLVGREEPVVAPPEDIDLVYTWVNCQDESWLRLYRDFSGEHFDHDRYRSRDELRYSLRSVYYNCSWVRTIFIVSNCAPPSWLDLEHGKVRWVSHSDILDANVLPTFNSHAIETGLCRIPGLARRFVYFNDDVFATRPVRSTLFFDSLGRTSSFLETTGKIVPNRSVDEESWFHARVNAQKLLLQRYEFAAAKMHHHCPFAVNLEHYESMLTEFGDAIRLVERNRQRSNDDIATVAFLYPHYALASGRGVQVEVNCQMLNVGNFRRFSLKPTTQFVCVNDGGGSARNSSFDAVATEFMHDRFSIPAPWEAKL